MKRILRAKPDCASRLTWSSTEWMLTGPRATGRSSPNTSMRSTRVTMRAASELISDGALLPHRHAMARPLGERGYVQIDLAIAADAARAEIDLVLVDRRAARAHLIDQRRQRAAERHQFLQRLSPQELRRNLEEGFGGDVGIDDAAVGRHQQHGVGQRVEDGLAVGGHWPAMFCG